MTLGIIVPILVEYVLQFPQNPFKMHMLPDGQICHNGPFWDHLKLHHALLRDISPDTSTKVQKGLGI